MRIRTRRTAAVVLAVALSLPTAAFAASKDQDRIEGRDPIARVVSKIKRLLGVSTNSDQPVPPYPTGPKP